MDEALLFCCRPACARSPLPKQRGGPTLGRGLAQELAAVLVQQHQVDVLADFTQGQQDDLQRLSRLRAVA